MGKNNQPGFCVLCGQEKLKRQFLLAGQGFYKCRNCRLIQMFPLPESLKPGDDYSGYDLKKQQRFARAFLIPQSLRAVRFIQEYQKEGKLLDVGCGTGEFLEVARKAGFAATGIEPSETACKIARQKSGVICGELKDIILGESFFDVVTLWSVLEHLPDPLPALKKIYSVLKPDGILALRVLTSHGLLPSLALRLYNISAGKISYPLKVIYQLDWHYKHFYFYDRKNIRLLLEKSGFELAASRRENSFDIRSLDDRMDYLPKGRISRTGFKTALFLILKVSSLLRRQDELVLVVRKIQGRAASF
jgi:2-polyprenyl-3-methyl-5-hydroxy-6-metoxy-1,4-benzoquinol methylase